MIKSLFTSILVVLTLSISASHYMGGEITWQCDGSGNYIFKTVLYRDCNGQSLSQTSIDLTVVNHPSLASITCNLVSSTDISPQCTQVAGSPPQIDCGTGNAGGNGVGAVQKFVFESDPITLSGVPPQEGWYFYWSGFSRNGNIDNIDNSIGDGITLYAKMFNHPSATGGNCYDNSPQFGMDPLVIISAGEPYLYNQAAIDPDLDSLHFSFTAPLDQFINGTFNPPSNPTAIDFATGYSYNNPTPDVTQNPGNIPAVINPNTGAVSFTSFTSGSYVYSIKVTAYRDGQKISENIRDIQVAVPNIVGYANNPPNITPPLNGNTSFEETIYAGDLVNFTLDFEDLDLLQDGTDQTISVEAIGGQFGAGYTNAGAGCNQPPCATLNQMLPATFVQNGQLTFNWQTTCDHLINSQGDYVQENAFIFVFKIADDYCKSPQIQYATVTIYVKDLDRLPAPEVTCLQVQPDGSVNVSWIPHANTVTGFQEYRVNNANQGTVNVEPNVNVGTYLDVSVDANIGAESYNIASVSGCDGHFNPQSPSLNTIFLELTNPGDGTAILQWTDLATPFPSSYAPWYYIQQEYPTGTWTTIDSVSVGETLYYRDTIDVCDAWINYRIIAEHQSGCQSISNIAGDQLQDINAPYIPIVSVVSVDTLDNNVNISWGANGADDTYGYIIYQRVNGFWEPIDTVWGRYTTDYEHVGVGLGGGALTYSVAAFDSCNTNSNPPTFQTSAKSELHTSIFGEITTNPCESFNELVWTEYIGWDAIENYQIIVSKNGGFYELVDITSKLEFKHEDIERGVPYCYYVVAIHSSGKKSYSNPICITSEKPGEPAFTYLSTASVVNNKGVEVQTYIDPVNAYDYVNLLRWNGEDFDSIQSLPYDNTLEMSFYDEDVAVNESSYTYKLAVIDTCGAVSSYSNIGRTILTKVTIDQENLKTVVQWSPYEGWSGVIVNYELYRGVDGLFEPNPIAVLPNNIRTYEDDVSEFLESEGQFCYKVKAIESINGYGFSSISFSNNGCAVRTPLIYIPNALYLKSEHGNEIFRPVISFYEYESYSFSIFNRWGDLIFNTDDSRLGWNGRDLKGVEVKQEVYVYMLTVEDANGKIHQRRGTVTVIK